MTLSENSLDSKDATPKMLVDHHNQPNGGEAIVCGKRDIPSTSMSKSIIILLFYVDWLLKEKIDIGKNIYIDNELKLYDSVSEKWFNKENAFKKFIKFGKNFRKRGAASLKDFIITDYYLKMKVHWIYNNTTEYIYLTFKIDNDKIKEIEIGILNGEFKKTSPECEFDNGYIFI